MRTKYLNNTSPGAACGVWEVEIEAIDLAIVAARDIQRTKARLARIIHQPLGASPRFTGTPKEPDASACRLICAVFRAG